MATVYTVASAKGGVGKTATTATLAALLADAGADVLAVDADIGMANLAGALGVDVDGPTIHDVLAGRTDPVDAVYEGPFGLRVVPGETDLEAYADADPTGLRDVVTAFEDAEYVFLDAGAGLSHDSALPLAIADETLLVSTPEREALTDTEKTATLTDRLGGDVAGAAITRVDPDDPGAADGLVDRHLDAAVLARVPEDDAVPAAVDAGEPLGAFAPATPATAAYRDLTAALTGVELPDPEPSDGGAGAIDRDAEDGAAVEEAAGGDGGDDRSSSDRDEASDGDEEATDLEAVIAEAEASRDDEGTSLDAVIATDDASEPGDEGATDETAVETGDGEAAVEKEGTARSDEATETGRPAVTAEAETASDDAGTEPERGVESVPFRDDEGDGSGPSETTRTEPGSDSDEDEATAEGAAEPDGDATEDAAEDGESADGDAESKGLFSRLLGR